MITEQQIEEVIQSPLALSIQEDMVRRKLQYILYKEQPIYYVDIIISILTVIDAGGEVHLTRNSVNSAMVWDETPQGNAYWLAIFRGLEAPI